MRNTVLQLLSLSCAVAALHCNGGHNEMTNAEMTQQVTPPLARAAARAVAGAHNFAMPDRYGAAGQMMLTKMGALHTVSDGSGSQEEIAAYLNAHVFAQANVIKQSTDGITYQISGASLCGGDDAAAGDAGATNGACVATVDSLKLQVQSKQVDHGFDLTMSMGTPSFEVGTLQIRNAPESVAVDLDVGSMSKIAPLLQGSTATPPTQITASGHVGIRSSVDNANNTTLQLDVLQPLQVADANGTTTLTVAKSDGTFVLASQGAVWTVTGNLGAVDLSVPRAQLTGSDDAGTLKAHLAGLTFQAKATGNAAEPVMISNFGLGNDSSLVQLDDAELFRLDLNAQSGRTLSATVDPNAQMPTISVTPGLNLSARWNLQPLANVLNLPATELQDSLVVDLQGSPAAVISPLEGDMMGVQESAIAVQQGQLSLTTHAGTVTVPQGQCLKAAPQTDPNNFLSAVTAAPCP